MFGLLSSSQIYGLQPAPNAADHHTTEEPSKSNSLPHKKGATAATQHRRSTSSLSDTGGKFFAHLSGKSPSQFIEKFIKSELLNGYDNLKCHQSGGKSAAATSPTESPSSTPLYSNLQTSSDWGGFSCLQGSYRSHGDGEFYEAVQVKTSSTQQQPQTQTQTQPQPQSCGSNEVNMRSKGTSSTILLQHYQKLPEPTLEPTFNTQAAGHTPAYKKLSFGSRLQKQIVEQSSDNSHTSSRNARSSGSGSGSEVQRSSSGSSSSGAIPPATAAVSSPERMQRRRLLQMISNYDQQNKQLHRDLAKEKRRRTEELACVVKSLICFESKLKNDMKVVNQRLVDRDTEICRLMRQNRALRKRLEDQQPDEGIADQDSDECLVLEALQCQNCRKQFYDIEVTASGTQTCSKELQGVGGKAEPGSSSDDTVSSSFYGARRSVRYTSKRTAGTFRDYMRSRAMHIDDAALEQQSEENTSSISREDSQTSYEQLHNYSRAMERMHGVKPTSMEDGEYSEQSSLELEQQQQQQRRRNSSSSRSSNSNSRSSKTTTPQLLEEDDGIFSPTQDDEDFDELDPEQEQQMMSRGALKIVQRRCADFSEASPKQIYETTTDDWYASASDQEETASTARVSTVKQPYGHGAVNPVLECVNQILLQQSMEETLREPTPKSAMAGAASNLPRRSSLSGRSVSNGRKRVHFSTKNSMVHVPRHDDHEEEEHEQEEQESHPMSASMISHYHPMTSAYESIYSNEYEPIGSERASNLYVDMAAAADTGAGASASSGNASKQLPQQKLPPALPPKPANLLKFKKSLHQLEESLEDEAALLEDDCATVSEPDYCSISEVGMSASVRVQIVADVHKAPECATTPPAVEPAQMVSPEVDSDDNQSHKTEEIEEIFADIPKLPNVAAIIAPKQSASEYLMMTPKRQELQLQLQLPLQPSPLQSQYKRKHVPNILAEINKRMSLPSSPTTPTTPKTLHNGTPVSKSLLQLADAASDLPLQAEFDWYNLDAEYDRSQEVTSTSKSPQTEGMLEEISEDNECLINADADEYNLDEEYQQEEDYHQEEDLRMQPEMEEEQEEGSLPQLKPQPQPHLSPAKATQMKKNLASFEKFIEGSGLSTKPLPSKRKIYFNAPFV